MPWNNQSGGNGGSGGQGAGGGPWAREPGRGIRPPDFAGVLRRALAQLRRLLPSGPITRRGLLVIALGALAVWLLSGVYFVSPDEEGVVLRFGRPTGETGPGINYHLPWPVEVAYTPRVTTTNQIDIGYRRPESSDNQAANEDVPEESHMLTGDENIVDINVTAYWRIKDAAAFLFNVDHPRDAIKAVAESALREVVGENRIEAIQTSEREALQQQVQDLMQRTLDAYGAGVTVLGVQMQKADPPQEVIDAYRDVQAARADQERMRNEAEAYANKIIPEARGQAAGIVQDAEAYRQEAIAEADGEAKEFLSVYAQYKKAPEVTRRRIYIETMRDVLAPMNKVIVDDGAKGAVPYFQLPPLAKAPPPAPAPAPAKGDKEGAP